MSGSTVIMSFDGRGVANGVTIDGNFLPVPIESKVNVEAAGDQLTRVTLTVFAKRIAFVYPEGHDANNISFSPPTPRR